MQPLRGVRIVDFTKQLPGPFCTQILADLGADVIKIEPPGGDPARAVRSAMFAATNRGKRSIQLNLKAPGGTAACLALMEAADVVVESFRPGVLTRLGIDLDALCREHPRLIAASLSGYGQAGARRHHPGHDPTYLAYAGALVYPGQWSQAGVVRSGLPVADLSSGLYAAIAVLAALRSRDLTGKGSRIDLAIADAALAWAAVRVPLDGGDPRAHLIPTNDVFRCADGGYVALGVFEEHFWTAARQVLGPVTPALFDPRFDTETGRYEHGDELYRLLCETFAREPAAVWHDRLMAAGVPVERVRAFQEAVQDPAVAGRGVLRPAPSDGLPAQVRLPMLFDGEAPGAMETPPALGAHGPAILREIGLGDGEIQALIEQGALMTA